MNKCITNFLMAPLQQPPQPDPLGRLPRAVGNRILSMLDLRQRTRYFYFGIQLEWYDSISQKQKKSDSPFLQFCLYVRNSFIVREYQNSFIFLLLTFLGTYVFTFRIQFQLNTVFEKMQFPAKVGKFFTA